jgi:hypothetical protein
MIGVNPHYRYVRAFEKRLSEALGCPVTLGEERKGAGGVVYRPVYLDGQEARVRWYPFDAENARAFEGEEAVEKMVRTFVNKLRAGVRGESRV